MAQKTSWTGAALTQTDINTYLMGEGGAWSTWTPQLNQNVTVTASVTQASYARYGRTIHFYIAVSCTSTGTAANEVTFSLPVTAASSGHVIPGGGLIYDVSATFNYPGLSYLKSTTLVGLLPAAVTSTALLGAVDFTAALVTSDLVQMCGTYQAAS